MDVGLMEECLIEIYGVSFTGEKFTNYTLYKTM